MAKKLRKNEKKKKKITKSINKLKNKISLKEKKISYREFWHPLNQQESYKNYRSKLNNANFVSKRGLWLASNFNLKVKDITDAFKK